MADMRMQLVLGLREKVLGPLKSIQAGSQEAAQALKSTRDRLRDLDKVQQDVAGMRNTRIELRGQQRDLQGLQEKMGGHNAGLQDQRERHRQITASLKTARESHANLTKALQNGAAATPEFSRQLEMARVTLLSSQGAYERSNASISKYRSQIKNTQTDIAQLTGKMTSGQERLQGYERRLKDAGIGTDRLGLKSRSLKSQIEAATTAVDKQKHALAALKVQQERVSDLKAQHAKAMMHTGMVAGTGVAMVAAGGAIARPVKATLGAYSNQEDASTQLSASMMQADGSVTKEFQEIDELAKRLGDRLPGTTADFIEMMTMLRRQGLSAKTILGGTGEAAALLGVQLRMPVTAAAEFAAKMQDATRTSEADMLGLMDMIQRTYYLGVDSGNMLQGFTKMSPVLSVIKMQGLDAASALAPLLVMMDQTGMAGESAGNAIRKVFQAGLDTKKLAQANEMLKQAGAGFSLSFTDKNGNFAGMDNLFQQVEKLKAIKSDTSRMAVIKKLFGDDAETLQVLNTLMDKGRAGYDEVASKMASQANLQSRVDKQLGTLSNVMEAAQGGFTNVMASIGQTVQGDAKGIINWIGEITSGIGSWVAEHPVLTAAIVRTVAVLAALTAGLGVLLVPLALIAGKAMLLRFAFGMLGVKLPGLIGGVRGLAAALGPGLQSAVAGSARAVPAALARIGLAMQAPARSSVPLLEKFKHRIKGVGRPDMPKPQATAVKSLPGGNTTIWHTFTAAMGRIPETAMNAGKSIQGAFGRTGAAIAAANTRLWAYLAAQKAAAIASARRGVASVATYAVMRGPTGIAKDALGGLGGLARSGIVGTLGGIRAGFLGVGKAVALVGRALLLNPMGLAIVALTGGAMLILKYWQPIKAFFSGLWAGFTAGLEPLRPMFTAVFGSLATALAPLRPLWAGLVGTFAAVWGWVSRLFAPFQATQQSLTGATQAGHGFGAWLASLVVAIAGLAGKFYDVGRDIVTGLINGITSMVGALGETISRLATSTIGWFKEKLGIHSPSRVFMAAGVNVGEGAALGIGSTAEMVRKSATAMAAAAAVSLPVPALSAPVLPAMQDQHVMQTVQTSKAAPEVPRALRAQPMPDMLELPVLPGMHALQIAPRMPAIQGQTEMQALQRMQAQPSMAALPTMQPLPATLAMHAAQLLPAQQAVTGMQHIPSMPVVAEQGSAVLPGQPDAIRIDQRQPLAARSADRPAPVIQGDTITLQIHAAPGMDEHAIARLVNAELERRERAKAARTQASFYDWNS